MKKVTDRFPELAGRRRDTVFSVKVPGHVRDRIGELAKQYGISQADLIIGLVNEELRRASGEVVPSNESRAREAVPADAAAFAAGGMNFGVLHEGLVQRMEQVGGAHAETVRRMAEGLQQLAAEALQEAEQWPRQGSEEATTAVMLAMADAADAEEDQQ